MQVQSALHMECLFDWLCCVWTGGGMFSGPVSLRASAHDVKNGASASHVLHKCTCEGCMHAQLNLARLPTIETACMLIFSP